MPSDLTQSPVDPFDTARDRLPAEPVFDPIVERLAAASYAETMRRWSHVASDPPECERG